MSRIVTMSGSVRTGSLNTILVNAAGAAATAAGHEVDAVDLGAFALPIYDGDFETNHGVPPGAAELANHVREADAIFIASPEYNGGPSALLKNSIDWISRVEMTVLANKPVGLLAASPGGNGGSHGIGVMTSLFNYMSLQHHGEAFSLPKAYEKLDDGALNAEESTRLAIWVGEVLAPLA